MHVAIVGAGALGRVLGVRLAASGGPEVTFVVRPARLADGAIAIERVDKSEALTLDAPARAVAIPASADVAIVCVRGDQLDAALIDLLHEGPRVPAVVMTPMMPQDYARLRGALGEQIVAAMPSVVAYVREDGVTRYWLPRAATTLIDEPRRPDVTLRALAAALDAARVATRFEMGVHEANPATTIAFIPLAMGLDAAGSIDALLGDAALLDLTLRAAGEAAELAGRVGRVAPWASLLTTFLGPTTLKMAVALARRRSPEGAAYVETHFAGKIHGQNVAMASSIAELARTRDTPHVALDALAARLRR